MSREFLFTVLKFCLVFSDNVVDAYDPRVRMGNTALYLYVGQDFYGNQAIRRSTSKAH